MLDKQGHLKNKITKKFILKRSPQKILSKKFTEKNSPKKDHPKKRSSQKRASPKLDAKNGNTIFFMRLFITDVHMFLYLLDAAILVRAIKMSTFIFLIFQIYTRQF